MHVGSEGVNYGVVDNLVQRDTITNNPIIHSSSLKGALREFFKDKWGEKDVKLNYIFGADSSRDEDKKNNESIGFYKFFEARLLSLPMRSDNKPFFNVTTKSLLDNINDAHKLLSKAKTALIENSFTDSKTAKEVVKLEDWETTANSNFSYSPLLGENVASFDNDTFKKVVKQLPVIARNKLDNGISKNLWYEEVVPRESRFVFFVAMAEKFRKEFLETIENSVVQIGGNASIGYGFTTIKKI
jgi:CRISPR-associated protein Cmr4